MSDPVLWPTTPDAWCSYFKGLDQKFSTDPRSPLHHDNRCPIHKA